MHGGNSIEPMLGFFQPDSQSHVKPSNSAEESWHVPFPQYTKSHIFNKSSAQTTHHDIYIYITCQIQNITI